MHRTIYEKSVFMDTGASYALVDNSDTFHTDAVSCLKDIEDRKFPLYISNVTIIETHKRILYDLGYSKAIEFLSNIYDGTVTILRLTEEDEREGKDIVHKFSDQNFSFADAVNFAIMKKYGIGKAFAFDIHFSVFGFERVPPFYD